MNKYRGIIIIISVVFLFFSSIPDVCSQEKINWFPLGGARNFSKESGKKVFLEVYADWCNWCSDFESISLADTQVVSYLNKNYYSVKMNAEYQKRVYLNGQPYQYIASNDSVIRGYHELIASFLDGKLSYPALVIFDPNFNRLSIIHGYMGPRELLRFLMFYKDDLYLHQDWDSFSSN